MKKSFLLTTRSHFTFIRSFGSFVLNITVGEAGNLPYFNLLNHWIQLAKNGFNLHKTICHTPFAHFRQFNFNKYLILCIQECIVELLKVKAFRLWMSLDFGKNVFSRFIHLYRHRQTFKKIWIPSSLMHFHLIKFSLFSFEVCMFVRVGCVSWKVLWMNISNNTVLVPGHRVKIEFLVANFVHFHWCGFSLLTNKLIQRVNINSIFSDALKQTDPRTHRQIDSYSSLSLILSLKIVNAISCRRIQTFQWRKTKPKHFGAENYD